MGPFALVMATVDVWGGFHRGEPRGRGLVSRGLLGPQPELVDAEQVGGEGGQVGALGKVGAG